MASVQAINSVTTFTANNAPKKKQYAGTAVGAGVAAATGALSLCVPMTKGVRILPALKTFAKNLPAFAGIGFLVDYLNNRQREKVQPNAKTEKGNDYTKVNNGKKYGAILGAAISLIRGILNRNKILGVSYIPFAIGVGISALAGFGLGALTDKIENKKAAKEADNVA